MPNKWVYSFSIFRFLPTLLALFPICKFSILLVYWALFSTLLFYEIYLKYPPYSFIWHLRVCTYNICICNIATLQKSCKTWQNETGESAKMSLTSYQKSATYLRWVQNRSNEYITFVCSLPRQVEAVWRPLQEQSGGRLEATTGTKWRPYYYFSPNPRVNITSTSAATAAHSRPDTSKM